MRPHSTLSYGRFLTVAAVLTPLLACQPDTNPAGPGARLSASRNDAGGIVTATAWGPETPPFNNEIILRDPSGGSAFGHVKFRQPNDADLIVYLDTWVRDLAPNTSYRLQRAVDVTWMTTARVKHGSHLAGVRPHRRSRPTHGALGGKTCSACSRPRWARSSTFISGSSLMGQTWSCCRVTAISS